MNLPVYYGNSMHRVFTPGEHLELADISFDALQPGDIVAVNMPGRKQYVHRVIEKTGSFAVTMGDNNAAADAEKIVPGSDFKLIVAAVDLQGKRRGIRRGSDGMRDFARHQQRRRQRLKIRKMLFKCGDLFFWRRRLQEKKSFGQEVCYYWKSRAVARLKSDGQIVYSSWRDFLRYRVPGDK